MSTLPYVIIDFDSTFVQVEALDELAKIALRDAVDRDDRVREIESITNMGMEGLLSFDESLRQRLDLLRANVMHLNELIHFLKENITPSFAANQQFLRENAERIFIISGGFMEYIYPVVEEFDIPRENILANSFVFDIDGSIMGYDEKILLSQDRGKVKQVQQMNLVSPIHVIGDGYTDYQIREEGLADLFFAFTENRTRENVVTKADVILSSLDDYIRHSMAV